MLLAVSIFVLTFASSAIVVFSSSKIVENKMRDYQQTAQQQFCDYLRQFESGIDVPIEVVTESVNESNLEIVLDTVTENFVYSYTTVFSDNENLYKSFKTSMTEYCDENNISASDKDVSKAACLVVDAVNEFFGGSSTSDTLIFKFVKSRKMIAIVVLSALCLLGSIVVLDLINYGRHKKYNQIGLGMATSGYLLVALPLVVRYMGYLEAYTYCSNPIYNPAIKECWSTVIKFMFVIGIVALTVGVIMLYRNYSYFRKKKKAFDVSRENNVQSRNEYMEALTEKKLKQGKSDVTEEKVVYQVDFSDK